jgi:hypothetical protein
MKGWGAMAGEQNRLRVNLGAREVEIEGSEDFIARYWKELQPLVENASAPSSPAENEGVGITTQLSRNGQDLGPSSFEEYRDAFGKLTDTDEVLIAGHFVTQGKSDPVFTGNEARDLLKKHGVNIASPSGLISNLVKSKKVFRDDATKGCRVSKKGIDYITKLRSKA